MLLGCSWVQLQFRTPVYPSGTLKIQEVTTRTIYINKYSEVAGCWIFKATTQEVCQGIPG